MHRPNAVALCSGGLDSTLAILIMVNCGVKIEALHFNTDLVPDENSQQLLTSLQGGAERYGYSFRSIHLGDKFLDIVKNPRHGYGKNMNPCIDCKILMLREAGAYMQKTKADFVITGEVLGQRPMSQMRPTIELIEKESGLHGKIVRPLSGQLFEPTIPEQVGLIKREWLLGISGRSRKEQLALATKLGVVSYATPAGGCCLTDPNYSRRLRDLMAFLGTFDTNDIFLLSVGRHFRLNERVKLIIGRDENDNKAIERLVRPDDCVFEVADVGSPVGLLRGRADDGTLKLAAAITARYSDAKTQDNAVVDFKKGSESAKIEVRPAVDEIVRGFIL